MLIKRHLEDELKKYLLNEQEYNNVLLLSGARQVGKSTLVEQVLKGFSAVSINLYERPTIARQIDEVKSFEELERLLKRELNFIPSQGAVLSIDEAQEAKQLGRWIRFFKEKWRNQKVIILGSILSNLFSEGIAYPVGRVDELVLRPFSFKEFLLATGRTGLIDIIEDTSIEKPINESDLDSFIPVYLTYLRIGGMPKIVLEHIAGNEEIPVQIDNILGQYAADIERYLGEIYRSMFLSSVKRIADITCYPIKMSQIISTDSPSYKKLPRLLEVQGKWHVIHKIAAMTKNPEASGGLTSKRYLFDVGFINFFINHGLPVEWSGRSGGGNIIFPKLQESFVCNELITQMKLSSVPINYYKETRNSREIDFIVPFRGTIVPIEVKSSTGISRNSLLPMLSFLEHKSLGIGVLVYNGPMKQIKINGRRIIAIPAFLTSEIERFL